MIPVDVGLADHRRLEIPDLLSILCGRFGYFLFFSAWGRGRGSPRRQEGGGIGFLLKIPGGGGVVQEGEGPTSWESGIGEFGGGGG